MNKDHILLGYQMFSYEFPNRAYCKVSDHNYCKDSAFLEISSAFVSFYIMAYHYSLTVFSIFHGYFLDAFLVFLPGYPSYLLLLTLLVPKNSKLLGNGGRGFYRCY